MESEKKLSDDVQDTADHQAADIENDVPETDSSADAAEETEGEAVSLTKTDDADAGENTDAGDDAAKEPAAESEDAGKGESTSKPDEIVSDEPQYSLKTVISDVKTIFQRYQLPDMFLLRCITLYFLLAGFWIIRLRHASNVNPVDGWHDFIANVSEKNALVGSVVFLIAGFMAISSFSRALPKNGKIFDQLSAIGSVLFFDVALLWRKDDFFLNAAVSFVSLVFVYYAVGKLKDRTVLQKIPWKVCGGVVLVTAACVTIFVAKTTIAKHNIFGTACHDFGLFVQMYHSLAKNLRATTTCERDKALSHFYIHSSYIYYLLVPIYKIIPKASTLLAAQAVLALGGVVPTFLIARRHQIKGLSLIFICFAYCFSIAIVGPCYYDFHENAFLPTLLMWFLWALDAKKMLPAWIFGALVCMVKEDAPLYVVCIGLFFFFENRGEKKRFHGVVLTVVSGVYMMFITSWLTKHGDGSVMTSIRFGNLMINTEGGLKEVVKNVLLDPSYFFSLLIHEDTLRFFLQVMLPLLFLPFFTKKIHRFWLMIPFVIMNMSVGAGYGYAANIGFHYIFGPFCLLLYAAILNLDDMGDERKHDLCIVLGASAMIFFTGTITHQKYNLEAYAGGKEGFQKVDAVLDDIPKDARLAASAFFVSHCADRDELYLFDFNDCDQDNNLILEPDRYDFIAFGPTTDIGLFAAPLLEQLGFTVYEEYDNRVVVYKSPNYTG